MTKRQNRVFYEEAVKHADRLSTSQLIYYRNGQIRELARKRLTSQGVREADLEWLRGILHVVETRKLRGEMGAQEKLC